MVSVVAAEVVDEQVRHREVGSEEPEHERRRRPGDRRAWEVSITPKGRRTLERAKRLAAEVEDEVLGGLTAADRRQLLTLLRRALVSAPPQPPWRPEEGD